MEALVMYFLIVVLVLLTFAVLMLTYTIMTLNTNKPDGYDIETLVTERDFYKEESKRVKIWDDFTPSEDFSPRTNDHLQTDKDGKFNPDEVPGQFDSIFETKEP